MKSFQWTIAAALVIAALVAFTMFDTKRFEKEAEKKAKSLNLLRPAEDDVVKIEMHPRGAPLIVLSKKGNDWFLEQPIQESADNQEVRNFLQTLQQERSLDTVIEGPETKLSTYGLDSPPLSLKVIAKDGQSEEIKIGAVKAYDSNLYAQIDNELRVLLVSPGWDMLLSKRLGQWRDKRVYREAGKPESVARLEIVQDDPGVPAKIDLVKYGGDKDGNEKRSQWKPADGSNPGFPLSNERIEGYIDQVKALRAQDFHADDKAVPGTLVKFRLQPPALTIRFFDQKKTEPFYELKFSPSDQKGDVFAASSDLKPIVSIFKMAAEPMRRRADDFFDKKLPFAFAAADASAVKITTPEIKVDLFKKGESWVLPDGDLHKAVDNARVSALIERLSQMEAARILEPITRGQEPKSTAKIQILKADGKPLLDFAWGEERIEKSAGSRPEARYILGRTNKVERVLGLSEKSLRMLDLAGLVPEPKSKPELKPEPKPAPKLPLKSPPKTE